MTEPSKTARAKKDRRRRRQPVEKTRAELIAIGLTQHQAGDRVHLMRACEKAGFTSGAGYHAFGSEPNFRAAVARAVLDRPIVSVHGSSGVTFHPDVLLACLQEPDPVVRAERLERVPELLAGAHHADLARMFWSTVMEAVRNGGRL